MKQAKFSLILIALSWVLSNIGTSNLYVWNEAFGWSSHPGPTVITAALAVGLYGFFFLYLKYIGLGVLRIAHDSHSGAVYVYNQIRQRLSTRRGIVFGIASTCVIISVLAMCADGVITGPASVSSALETSRAVIGSHYPWIREILSEDKVMWLPKVTVVGMVILSLLFFVHRFGPSRFNPAFGPLAVLYFASSLVTGVILCTKTGGFGLLGEAIHPLLLPEHIRILLHHEHRNEILGGLFLFFSGFEAAFTDAGLTGKKSMLWAVNIFFVCVVFQYVGQANMLKNDLLIDGSGSPFAQGLLKLPPWLGITHSVLAVAGTIMAAFSLMVALQHVFYELAEIEWFARLKKKYFGEGEFISYFLNFTQWMGCMAIYASFQHSKNMLAMYGISVCAVLLSTGILIGVRQWLFERGWIRILSVILIIICAAIEGVFFEASLHKWSHGGYVSVLIMLLVLPTILAWIYFEIYKKCNQYIVAPHNEMGTIIQQEISPLLVPDGINAVYCKKVGDLTSTDFCAMRDLVKKWRVKKLYLFSDMQGDQYDLTVTNVCPDIVEILRTYPYKHPQYNDDVLNEYVGTYQLLSVPETEWGPSDWVPFRANRNLENTNGDTGLVFGIGKLIYEYLKTKEEKVVFNQPVIALDVPVKTTKHLLHTTSLSDSVGTPIERGGT